MSGVALPNTAGLATGAPPPRAVALPDALFSPIILACFATAASIALQGFSYGANNNVFHEIVVLRLYDLPQFAHDPVVQSLRHFVTPVYRLLSLVADESNIAAVFFACHVATRVLTFLGLILIMDACGLGPGWRRAVGAVALVVARGIYGESAMGGDGMLLGYFTHSELAQGFALIAVALLVRGRLFVAAAVVGLTLDINAFMGVWMVAPLGLACLVDLVQRRTSHHLLLRGAGRIALAATIVLALALPVLLWIVAVLPASPPGFDYPAFLRFYWGKHFFLSGSSLRDFLMFVAAALSGFVAAGFLERRAAARVSLLGLLAVLATGVVVGKIAHSPLILNLHLIRVDGLIVLVSAALVAAAAIRLLDPARPGRAAIALATLAGLAAGVWAVPMLALALLAAAESRPARAAMRLRSFAAAGAWLRPLRGAMVRRSRLLAATTVVVLGAMATLNSYSAKASLTGAGTIPKDSQFEGSSPAAPEWRQVQLWAREATPSDAIFLVPLRPLGFRVGARRVAWVDWKEGATVLWSPETHRAWSARMDEVGHLRTAQDWLDYGCAHRLSYVVIDKRPWQAGWAHPKVDSVPVFGNRFFDVYALKDCS